MTTAWAHLVHGNVVEAARANLGGLLLALFLLAAVVPVCRIVVNGQLPKPAVIRNATITLLAVVMITLTEWAVRLATS